MLIPPYSNFQFRSSHVYKLPKEKKFKISIKEQEQAKENYNIRYLIKTFVEESTLD